LFISFEQLVLLLLLAFILFGPEKLPEYAEKLGRLVAHLRQASSEITQQVQQPLQNLRNHLDSPKIYPDVTCPQCRQTLDHDFIFCPHCGHRLKEGPGPQQLGG
jgi:Sec-independent protein translocase protein TatA